MCGIIACLLEKEEHEKNTLIESLLFGLEQLQNRGYDSAGITSISSKSKFTTHKFASSTEHSALVSLKEKRSQYENHYCGIAHTRWATHGSKTNYNSHPHISFDGEFALVHNGILENFQNIKSSLKEKNIPFYSQTDSEVIVNYITYHYHTIIANNRISVPQNTASISQHKIWIKQAIQNALQGMEGTWGIVLISIRTPETLYCFRHGSPLLISYDNHYAYVGSEQSAFGDKVNNYITIDNHDICILSNSINGIQLESDNQYQLNHISNICDYSKEGYTHWMKKEIYEQVDASLRAISLGGRLLSNNKVKLGGLYDYQIQLRDIEHVILLGCGTSYYAGCIGVYIMKHFLLFKSIQIIDGSDFDTIDIPREGKTAIIFLSQSGETRDLHRCIYIAKQCNALCIGVVNVVDSMIAREVDCGCYINAGREVGVASTKSFTSQVLVLIMLSIYFAQIQNIQERKRIQLIKDLRKFSKDVEDTLKQIEDTITEDSTILSLFDNKEHCFILGKGIGECIAKEGALKIKEVSYIHAEGYSSSSLKHGPFALLDENFPVILLDTTSTYRPKLLNAYEEIQSRKAPIIWITNSRQYESLSDTMKESSSTHIIQTACNTSFQEILYIIPLQYISYMLSVRRGLNPDMPRNLAKVVTVD